MSTFSRTIVYNDPVLLPLEDAPTVEQCHGNDVPLVPKAQLLGALDILGHFVAWKRSWQQRQQCLLCMICMIFTYIWIFEIVFECVRQTVVHFMHITVVDAKGIQKCLLTNFDWQILLHFIGPRPPAKRCKSRKGHATTAKWSTPTEKTICKGDWQVPWHI